LIGEPSAVLFRRLDDQREFDPAYRQLVDMEMWFHLLEQGDLVYTRATLCCFRQHSGQQTAVNEKQRAGDGEWVRLLKKYAQLDWLLRESSPMDKCGLIHAIHKARQTAPDGELDELEQRFRRALGAGWPIYNPLFRLGRVAENLGRSTLKRIIRAGIIRE
jgi:hypothetical protein